MKNIIGRKVYSFKKVGSTNTIAKKLAKEGAEEGTLVISDIQTEGRGRFGRPWISTERGLWFSIILKPQIKKDVISVLPLLAAVAVARAIFSLTLLKTNLKWPNDVLINKKKVAGILLEAASCKGRVDFVILGIGINVNQRKEGFPEELREKATSIFEETGRKVEIKHLLREVVKELEKAYLSFLKKETSSMIKAWKKMDICLGKNIRVVTQERGFEAKALDINERGALIISLPDGQIKSILSGEVSLEADTEIIPLSLTFDEKEEAYANILDTCT